MSQINGFKFLILIWCICLLTRTVYLSSIKKKNENDEDTTNKLKNILLKKLDLDEEPTNLGDTNVPNYLLDLFETNSLFENNRILLLDNSNTIRSHPLINYNLINLNNDHSFNQQLNRSGFLIKFNLTLPKKELLNAGEFRLYLNVSSSNQCTSNRQRITIHQIIQQFNNPIQNQLINSSLNQNLSIDLNNQFINQYLNQIDEEKFIYRQIDSLVCEQNESKWLQFDVLPAIESWIKKSSINYGLLIKSNCVDQNNFNINENIFIDNIVFKSSSNDQYDNFKPCLLTYSNFQNADFESDNDPLDFINKKKRHINQEINQNLKLTSIKNQDCSRYSMYVDFREIGWDDWLIAPRGYEANYCDGHCSLSVIRNGNTTNHATMQSLSNGLQPDIPPPCCVPTEYAPITMIYKDKDTSVLKIYENMIVKKCNCL